MSLEPAWSMGIIGVPRGDHTSTGFAAARAGRPSTEGTPSTSLPALRPARGKGPSFTPPRKCSIPLNHLFQQQLATQKDADEKTRDRLSLLLTALRYGQDASNDSGEVLITSTGPAQIPPVLPDDQ